MSLSIFNKLWPFIRLSFSKACVGAPLDTLFQFVFVAILSRGIFHLDILQYWDGSNILEYEL